METFRARAEMVRNWRRWVATLANAVRKVVPDSEVYVFGSAMREETVASSDIDILVVAATLPKRARELAELRIKIQDEAGLPSYHPFEVHFVTRKEAEPYFTKAGKYMERL